MTRLVYLDNQATTPCDPRVVDAMLPFFTERFGNPHSAEHAMGHEAEDAVERARAQLAALIGADPREIVFTSGATEANNLAIKGAARFAASQGSPRRRVITVVTEHRCVLESVADLAAEGFDPVILPVSRDGLLDPARLADALATPTVLVSVMAANNETGVLQDLPTFAAMARGAGALFHTDAAQALGKVAFDVAGLDLASFSAHKLYGPKGVGALYVRRRPRVRLLPLLSGGGQERGLRSGTLPTPLLVGFGEACRIAGAEMAGEARGLAALRERLLTGLRGRLPGLRVNGAEPPSARQPQRHPAACRRPGRDAGRPAAVRVHRLGLLLRRRGALERARRHGPGPGRGGADLACGAGTLYLRRRCGFRHRGAVQRSRTLSRPEPMPKMTFVERDGTSREVSAPLGLSVLEVAHKHGVDIEGACEGSLACSTCHVIVDPAWFAKLPTPTEDEEDMLDLAFGLEKTSRLGCQLVMTEALDGLVVRLPAATRNAQG